MKTETAAERIPLNDEALLQAVLKHRHSSSVPCPLTSVSLPITLSVEVGNSTFRMFSSDLFRHTGNRFLQHLSQDGVDSHHNTGCGSCVQKGHVIVLQECEVPEAQIVFPLLELNIPTALTLNQLVGVIQSFAYINALDVLQFFPLYLPENLNADQVVTLLAVSVQYLMGGPLVLDLAARLTKAEKGQAIQQERIVERVCCKVGPYISHELCQVLMVHKPAKDEAESSFKHVSVHQRLLWLTVQAYICNGECEGLEAEELPAFSTVLGLANSVCRAKHFVKRSLCSCQIAIMKAMLAQPPSWKLTQALALKPVVLAGGSLGRFAAWMPVGPRTQSRLLPRHSCNPIVSEITSVNLGSRELRFRFMVTWRTGQGYPSAFDILARIIFEGQAGDPLASLETSCGFVDDSVIHVLDSVPSLQGCPGFSLPPFATGNLMVGEAVTPADSPYTSVEKLRRDFRSKWMPDSDQWLAIMCAEVRLPE